MHEPLSDSALNQLFREARTYQWFDGREVSEAQMRSIYELTKMGPTSMNQQPLRILWCKTPKSKSRLAAHTSQGNVAKVENAPVCAILAMDTDFHEYLHQFAPHMDNPREKFAGRDDARYKSAFRNGTLQGGYFIMAARALGLDCGPMSGFDNDAVDADFFAGHPSWRSNFICSVGYGDRSKIHPRAPRPEFDTFNSVT